MLDHAEGGSGYFYENSILNFNHRGGVMIRYLIICVIAFFSYTSVVSATVLHKVRCDDCDVVTHDDPLTTEAAVLAGQTLPNIAVGDLIMVVNGGTTGFPPCMPPLRQSFTVLSVPVSGSSDLSYFGSSSCELQAVPPTVPDLGGGVDPRAIIGLIGGTPIYSCSTIYVPCK